jgi:polar amino acid transport system permease protein
MEALGTFILTVAGAIGLNDELLARYGMRFLEGLWVTIQIVVISMILGAVIAFPTAMARMSKNRIARGLSFATSTSSGERRSSRSSS